MQLKNMGIAVLPLLVTAFVSYASHQANAEACLDEIKKTGGIKSANGLMGLKPYVWKNQDGTYSGFEWEIFQEVAKRIGGVKPDYEITEWTTMIPGLKAKRWDIILSGMSVTQERIQGAGINYSNPYFMLYDLVIVPGDSPIKTMDDLKGKTVSSTLGTMDSINAHALVDSGAAANVLDFNTFGEPFVALQNHQVDAVILDQATLLGQKETTKDLRSVGKALAYRPKPEFAEAESKAAYILGGTAVGVRQECDDLRTAINDALASMDADGTRTRILEKYGIWDQEQVKLMK
jgi:ABC-type amino acid transport substrate-binding protein